MKQRRLNRLFIYVFLVLIILCGVGMYLIRVKEIAYADMILPGLVILTGLLTLRFFNIDGSNYKREMNKAKEKNRMLFVMIPELFTEEGPDENKMQVDGDANGEFGVEKGKIRKDSFLSHIHPDHLERYRKAYRQMLSGAAMTSVRMQWADVNQVYIWCDYHMTAAYNDKGKIERIVGVLVSNDRKQRSDSKREQIIDSMKNVYSRLIYLDIDADQYEFLLSDDIVYYNYEKTGTFQTINEDYIGQYVNAAYRDRLREVLSPDYMKKHLDEDHRSYQYQYPLITETEDSVWEVLEVILVSMDNKKASQVLISVRDRLDPQI